MKFLSRYGITKDDPDFKEVFGFVYRGASFSLVSHWIRRVFCCDFNGRGLDAHYFDLPTEDVHEIGGYQYEPDR